MTVKKQILFQTVACVLNILFSMIAQRFATFFYVAGVFIYAIAGLTIVLWGIRTILHWRELDIAWGAINVLNIACAMFAVLSGVGHVVDVISRGWYPPF